MAAGATAVYNLAVTPLSGFSGMVALSCTGAPAGSSCTPSAASVNVSGAAVPITVSVTTAAATVSYPQSRRQPRIGPLAVLPLSTLVLIAGKRRRRLISGLFYLVLLVSVRAFVGCGGGNPAANVASPISPAGGGTTQPAPVTSMLTLSGSSGTQTRTVSLTLNVQ
jgi:hypothetical protein